MSILLCESELKIYLAYSLLHLRSHINVNKNNKRLSIILINKFHNINTHALFMISSEYVIFN